MTEPAGSRPSTSVATHAAEWAALPLMLIAPFAAFLKHHQVPFLEPMAFGGVAALITLGLVFRTIAASRWESVRPLVFAAFLMLSVDLGVRLAATPFPDGLKNILGIFTAAAVASGLFVVFSVVTYLLRRHLGVIFCAVFGAVLVSTLIIPATGDGKPARNVGSGAPLDPSLPPVIHLVLDEHIGIEGIPTDIPGGTDLKEEIKGFYRRHGFRLYGGAYSEYAQTDDSIANLLNGDRPDRIGAHLVFPSPTITLAENAWFRRLAEQGYAIRVYQSDYMDFCTADGVGSCFQYPVNSPRSLIGVDVPVLAKLQVTLTQFFYGSVVYLAAKDLVARLLTALGTEDAMGAEAIQPALGPIESLRILSQLGTKDVVRGVAIFGHLMLPHHSFIFDSACRVKANASDWLNSYDLDDRELPARRQRRYERYFWQVRCLYKKLDELLDRLAVAKVLDGTVVIIHGDHGSRIVSGSPRVGRGKEISERYLLDMHSTLFAVRGLGGPPEYDSRPVSVHTLFCRLALGCPPTDDRRPAVYVYPWPRVKNKPLARHPYPAY